MGHTGPLSGGEGAAGLGWFLFEQPGGLGGAPESGFDLCAVEDATGDEAVEADAGLVQRVVARAPRCGGKGCQFLLQYLPAVGVAGQLRAELAVLGPFRYGRQYEPFEFRWQWREL
jgi:hypothetical protein